MNSTMHEPSAGGVEHPRAESVQVTADDIAADNRFESALNARDEKALASEIQRRLNTATFGTTIWFRIGPGHKTTYEARTKGEGANEHKTMARDAARALIAYAVKESSSPHCQVENKKQTSIFDRIAEEGAK